jgi:hypothetical protein
MQVSKAIEIAEERFAKGEISKEEFEAIKAQLQPKNSASQSSNVGNNVPSQEAVAISKTGAALWLVLGVFSILTILVGVSQGVWRLFSLQ